jgi:hypothetical protein
MNEELGQHLAPEAASAALHGSGNRRHPTSLRAFICMLILFLIAFGSAYSLVNYLLLATSVSAACTASTVYIPVTQTTTVTSTYTPYSLISSSPSSSALGAQPSSSTVTSTSYSTLYSTSTFYNTVTITSLPPGSVSTSYITIVTETQTLSPVSTLPSTSESIQSTTSSIETVTPPPYTTTSYIVTG